MICDRKVFRKFGTDCRPVAHLYAYNYYLVTSLTCIKCLPNYQHWSRPSSPWEKWSALKLGTLKSQRAQHRTSQCHPRNERSFHICGYLNPSVRISTEFSMGKTTMLVRVVWLEHGIILKIFSKFLVYFNNPFVHNFPTSWCEVFNNPWKSYFHKKLFRYSKISFIIPEKGFILDVAVFSQILHHFLLNTLHLENRTCICSNFIQPNATAISKQI